MTIARIAAASLLALLLAAAPAARGRAQDGGAPEPGREPSAEVRAFLAKWAETMRGVDRLRVTFTQSKKLRILREPRESSGQAVLLGKIHYGIVNWVVALDTLQIGLHDFETSRLATSNRRRELRCRELGNVGR